MPTRTHEEAMAEVYANDPQLAVEIINSTLDDGDQSEMLVLIGQLTRAFGGMQQVAEHAGLNPTQLYRTLSAEGNPSLSTLRGVLKVMGLQLAVTPIKAA